MFILTISGLLALVFGVAGFLIWSVLWLFKVRRKGRRIFKVTAISYVLFLFFFIFCIFPIIAAELIASAGTRPQDRELKLDPATFGCDFEEVEFSSRDGLRLSGWWMKGAEGKCAFILSHGLFRDRKEVLERACRFNQLGHDALVFDLRNHGLSQGDSISMGYHERLDVLGAYDALNRWSSNSVVPLGVSMGAVATLKAAAEYGDDVVAVVADSPFQSLEETVARHADLLMGLPSFPFCNFFTWYFTRINGFPKEDLDLTRTLQKGQSVPILLIYGGADERMPAATARAIYQAIPSADKKMVFFEGAGHGDAWETDPEQYISVITEFLASLKAGSGRGAED